MDSQLGNVDDDYASSVGAAFQSKQIYTLQHPAYINFSNDVTEELTRIAERVAAQRSTARRLAITTYLDADQVSGLQEMYPEFAPVYIPLNRLVHSFWSACRVAANEWCAVSTDRYASSCVHYGGSLLSTLLRKAKHVHLESDGTDEAMVHQRHTDAVDVYRIFGDYASVQSNYGLVVPRVEYDEYLKARSYTCCDKPSVCTVQADAMCIDLTVSSLSKVQVAMSMLQHGAEICHGFFIYHPIMLVQDKGELPATGVHFERTDGSISFRYPEGRVGVTSYSRTSYAGWLASHCFYVGENKQWFQLELLKNRGCFMFFRMVKVDGPVQNNAFKHALDLPGAEDYTLVRSWKLKEGLKSDATKADGWVRHSFLVRSRVVRRVREFAMQLQPSAFTRYAIKKQIRLVNNRWVLTGSSVTVSAPLDPGEVESLTTAIFARAFVDRYESSQLSSEMMAQLKVLTGFQSASMLERLRAVEWATVRWVFSGAVGRIDSWFRDVLDGIIRFFSSATVDGGVSMLPGPTYVKLESAVGTWRGVFTRHGEVLYKPDTDGVPYPVVATAAGGALATLVTRFGVAHARRRSRAAAAGGEEVLDNVVRVATDIEDTRVAEASYDSFVQAVAELNEMDSAPEARYNLEYERAVREAAELVQAFSRADDPDPVGSLNQLYLELFPSVANQALEYDTFSLSLDPQDRTLEAPMLRMPLYFGLAPAPRSYYRSRLKALNVPKRQNTAPELLTAIAARNLSAPVVSIPQEEDVIIRDIWDNFLAECCVESAEQKLREFQDDPVALAADALKDWSSKAKPGVVDGLVAEMEKNSQSLGEKRVDEYLAMLKSDVKPTLSTKPVTEVTAPQVIVYHEKLLSALYSSMFRVLVRRFLSLLKPNYHVNLLKDTRDVAEFITAVHPFGASGLNYLENDFSKYDKSQSAFVFRLEEFVFRKLGLNHEMLSNWVHGHVECSLRSLAVGLSLHVMYQRKSGDSTTAFGNVLLNVLSVSYAYKGTAVQWAVFMGDDSLVCAKGVVADTDAVQLLAEVFNLSAKYYVTEAPYFASNFVLIDENRLQAKLCPDVVKRVERLSMHVSADDPQWDERFMSFRDAMAVFLDESVVQQMAVAVPQRYEVSEGLVRGAVGALGTLAANKKKFRSMWEDQPEVLQA